MAEPVTLKIILLAIIGGVLPALVWLWFWLREDSKKPEPIGLIALSFLAGAIGVIIAFILQKLLIVKFGLLGTQSLGTTTSAVFLLLAGIEEIVKYGVAWIIALRTRYFDEPIDAMIYLITVALGFAAMENFFYVFNILSVGDIFGAVMNAQMRFMGATLLHVVASASIGFFIGLSYYKKRKIRLCYLVYGILTAVLLHWVFNLLIIKANTVGEIFQVFFFFWIIVIIFILLFEKIKQIKSPLKKIN